MHGKQSCHCCYYVSELAVFNGCDNKVGEPRAQAEVNENLGRGTRELFCIPVPQQFAHDLREPRQIQGPKSDKAQPSATECWIRLADGSQSSAGREALSVRV